MIFTTNFIVDETLLDKYSEDREKIIEMHMEEAAKKTGFKIKEHYPFLQEPATNFGRRVNEYRVQLMIVPMDKWMEFRNEINRNYPELREMIIELESK